MRTETAPKLIWTENKITSSCISRQYGHSNAIHMLILLLHFHHSISSSEFKQTLKSFKYSNRKFIASIKRADRWRSAAQSRHSRHGDEWWRRQSTSSNSNSKWICRRWINHWKMADWKRSNEKGNVCCGKRMAPFYFGKKRWRARWSSLSLPYIIGLPQLSGALRIKRLLSLRPCAAQRHTGEEHLAVLRSSNDVYRRRRPRERARELTGLDLRIRSVQSANIQSKPLPYT